MFALHPRLAADTIEVSRLPLCELRLMNDARFPWLILVPMREGITEIHALDAADRLQLMDEIVRCSQALESLCKPDKINVGALGNLVPQLHVHVVARRIGDAAWPGPVWGSGAAVGYEEEAVAGWLAKIMAVLAEV